jgi:hypothetical protein
VHTPRVRWLLTERCQNQEIGVIAEQLEPLVGAQQQQRITDLQSLIGKIRSNRPTFTPDTGKLEAIAFPEIELTNRFSGEA